MMVSPSGNSSSSGISAKGREGPGNQTTDPDLNTDVSDQEKTVFEKEVQQHTDATYSSMEPRSKPPLRQRLKSLFKPEGKLRPFRLLKQDIRNVRKRYLSDWTLFNQLVFASAVYVFFTNILPGITFASDLYVRTGANWGTIEIVFSTGLCGIIFSLWVRLDISKIARSQIDPDSQSSL